MMSSSDQLASTQFNPTFASLGVLGATTLQSVSATSLTAPIKKSVVVAAAGTTTTLTAAQSGSLVTCGADSGLPRTIALPTLANGLQFRIVFEAQASGVSTTITAGGTTIKGNIVSQNTGSGVSIINAANNTTVVRSATAANTGLGDYLEFVCNTTSWFVSGVGYSSGGGNTFSFG